MDEDRNGPDRFFSGFEQFVRRGGISKVRRYERRVQFARQRLSRLFGNIAKNEASPLARQCFSNAAPNARRRAGDKRSVALKQPHMASPHSAGRCASAVGN